MAIYWVLRPFVFTKKSGQSVLVEPNRYFDTSDPAEDVNEETFLENLNPIAFAAVSADSLDPLRKAREKHQGNQLFGDWFYVFVGPEVPTHP